MARNRMNDPNRGLTKTGVGNGDGWACLGCGAGYDTCPPGANCYQVDRQSGVNCPGLVVPFARYVKEKGLDPLD